MHQQDFKEIVSKMLRECSNLVLTSYGPTVTFTAALCKCANELLKFETSEDPWFSNVSFEFADAIRYLTSGMHPDELEDCKKGLIMKVQDRLTALHRPTTTVWLNPSPIKIHYADVVYPADLLLK